jgi:flavin reductase (DIM6/NTAB) family NADH-FMN oxidoreductase RutF
MDVRREDISTHEMHRILLTAVAPRPIAWVSSVGLDGNVNLAPFSYFNAICTDPPLLGFSPTLRQGDLRQDLGPVKDTLRNIRETAEFVVNVVTFPLVHAMNVTGGEWDASVNEFELAKLSMAPSQVVKAPRVGESPVNFECRLYDLLTFGDLETGGNFVIGEVVAVHLQEEVLRDGKIDADSLDLVARMGGRQYCRATDRFELVRPQRKPGAPQDR